MILRFKSTKFAATLACAMVCGIALTAHSQAQETTATIRLNSPGQQDGDELLPTLEAQPSIAPLPDANTMPLLRLATKGAMGGLDDGARPAVFTAGNMDDPNIGFAGRAGFTIQEGAMPVQQGTLISPAPMAHQQATGNHQLRSSDRTDSRALSDEYIFDGDDRGTPVGVDENWTIYGMQTEDTFGHFDTVDGRRLVSPSNRVKIYSPRFAAVRKVDGVYNARRNTRVGSFDKKLVMQTTRGKDFSSSTMQNVALNGIESAKRASGFEHRTRGVVADQAIELIGVRNSFSAYENLELIKWGRHSNSQTARLQLGMQSANAWQDNMRLQVHAKGAQPIVVNDLSSAQQIIHVESDGKGSVLRVTKVASRIAADIGEEVEFTIRFDNLSSKPVGNVTLVDNLTGRLQYVPGSAECSMKAKFIEKLNEANSLMLRWEITDPVKPFKGGIIRFKCRVH
ncbi:DUF11 domain-containing protein [Mariniblastus fucicola]|uniref:DUF11 domain-containing protein n=1 Tax=Mariniblastus fucicola TaxID=980251 RepID=A0A5B9PGZ0_9BACT|nr:DUF11 domain-containing protein [Mariniblastus fucicola]QEG24505.1 hypothetical protein MFFC18_44250 [Mariniblastus fucicola]